jgi:predicted transcriptional regulator
MQRVIKNKMSIHIPQTKLDDKPVERLIKLGNKRDRTSNYLVVEAILEYLDREKDKLK